MVDTDADGLADQWEGRWIDVNEDGTPDQFLPAADPNKKDIYVEVDAMDQVAPDPPALTDVESAFANAPAASIDNPDGSTGITLHAENGGDWSIPTVPWNSSDSSGLPAGMARTKNGTAADHRDGTFGLPADRALPNWPNIRTARLRVYRYTMFAFSIPGGHSGIASLPGNDVIVSIGNWPDAAGNPGGTRDEQAGTFMHELGHALNLHHGGADDTNYKPNYFSVMNYLWQNPSGFAWSASRRLDYSRVKLPDVDEANFNEFAGLGGDAAITIPIGPYFPTLTHRIAPQGGPFDFNGDGNITSSATVDMDFVGDNNGDNQFTSADLSPGGKYSGHDDWSNLRYSLMSGDVDNGSDMTYDEWLFLRSSGTGPGVIEFSTPRFEAEERTGMATISVVRAGGNQDPVSVRYRTLTGSATAGSDYAAVTNGLLSFATGEYIKTFTIPLVNDAASEGTETVQLELFNPTGTTLGS